MYSLVVFLSSFFQKSSPFPVSSFLFPPTTKYFPSPDNQIVTWEHIYMPHIWRLLREEIVDIVEMEKPMTRCQIWGTIELRSDPISKVLSEWKKWF